MKHLFKFLLANSFLISFALFASVNVGEKTPDFSLTDSKGKSHKLSDYKGKYVVLEWVNYDCPFVVKQYQPGKMQQLQNHYKSKEVIWLSINSSAPGKQGYFSPDAINQRMVKEKAMPTAYLIDSNGQVGRLYGARATPHLFIIDPEQKLIYEGAIDNIRSADPADVAKATNYVELTINIKG